MSLCSFGIFGTSYIRDEPLPDTLELVRGQSMTLRVLHIYSEYDIGTTHEINLRQPASSPLSFVMLTEQASQTAVKINSEGLALGDYLLYLESFDTLSTIFTTLKMDTIIVIVESYVRTEPLPTSVEVGAGESTTILVPHIYSEIDNDIVMAINLRHETINFIPFVTFTSLSDATEVYIDATGEVDGVETLSL